MILPESRTSHFTNLASGLRFVLVETSRAGNIGAAARAMKTMGFSDLVLVNPRFPDAIRDPEAVAFASGAQDILESARIVGSIEEALAGCQFTAAVTARLREFSPPVLSPRKLAATLAEMLAATAQAAQAGQAEGRESAPGRGEGTGIHRAALLFGNERFGLPNEAVVKCNGLINIPANPEYSSLNLAQAVQVLAYECRVAFAGEEAPSAGIGFVGDAASAEQIEGMFTHLEQALVKIDFLDPASPRKLMPRLRRMFARTGLETEEVNILRGIAKKILDRP